MDDLTRQPESPSDAHAMLREIPLEAITFSTTAAQTERRKRFDKAALGELAASIRQVGVLQPVLVRPFRAAMSGAELATFLQICYLAPDLRVSTWSTGKPERLLAAAAALKIDPKKVRSELAAAAKAKAPAKRPGKKR